MLHVSRLHHLLPRGGTRCVSTMSLHETAEKGFGSDNVDRYNRGRPGYSSEVLGLIQALVHGGAGSGSGSKDASIVEIGAGTGKFTTHFLDTYPHFKRSYTAIEPSAAFRNQLAESIPGMKVLNGFGESTGLAAKSADAAIFAQAFHWMANHNTLAEMDRILRPGSPMILVWNTMSRRVPWQAELEFEVISPHYTPDVPRQQTYKWKEVFSSPPHAESAQSLFRCSLSETPDAVAAVLRDLSPAVRTEGVLNLWTKPRTVVVSMQRIIDRALSVSVISCQSDDAKQAVAKQIEHLLRTHEDTRGLVARDQFRVVYETELCWTYTI